MTPESRSNMDAAVSKYLGEVEKRVAEFRRYIVEEWNQNPNEIEIKVRAYSLHLDIALAHAQFELDI